MNIRVFITAKQGTKLAYLIITLNSLRRILQSKVNLEKKERGGLIFKALLRTTDEIP
jgi:hypothetical protein